MYEEDTLKVFSWSWNPIYMFEPHPLYANITSVHQGVYLEIIADLVILNQSVITNNVIKMKMKYNTIN